MSILDMIKRHGDSAGDPDETSPNGKREPVSVEANDQPHDGPDTAPPPARDETGAWDLIELGKRPGETGEAARDFGAAIDELRGTATEFSIGAARSAVSVGVIGNGSSACKASSSISPSVPTRCRDCPSTLP